jgi:hypothetical protein
MAVKTKRKTKWRNRFYVDIYRLAVQGLSDEQIAQAIGVSVSCFSSFKKKRSTVRYALKQAKNKDSRVTAKNFFDYVYKRLPENVRELYDKITAIEDEPNAVAKIEAMLEKEGKYARMQVFLHALVTNNFNPSKARRRANITKITLNDWIRNEPGFKDLIEEMHENKQNFAEEALMKLVAKGDPNAVIFVNKTLNKDRGYADKQTIEHTGTIKHEHQHKLLDLDKLQLSLACRKEIVDAVRKLRKDETPKALEYRVKDDGNGHLKAEPADDDLT